MLEIWEERFDDCVLARGSDYYKAGKVQITDQDKNNIFALVDGSGSLSYQVKIKLVNNNVADMTCTCPYADGGNSCKHMAAVLYAASKTQTDSSTANQPHDSLREIILTMDEDDAKNLLLSEAQKSPTLSTYIRNVCRNRTIDMSALKHEIATIKQHHSDRYGFIDYHHAFNYARELGDFMERYISSMISTQKYRLAFELTCCIYHSLGNLSIDDSGGEITMLADSCLSYWQEIIDKCSPEDTKFFFGWFKQHLYDYVVDYLQCHIDDFFVDNFHDPDMLKQKLEILDVLIAKADTKTDDESLLSFELENYVAKRLRVMEELCASEDEIIAFCQKYYHLPDVRHFMVQRLLEKNEVARAVEILKESKRIDHAFPGLVAQASEQLMQLYQRTDQNQLYQQELEDYIRNCRQDNLDHIESLKRFYDEKGWKKKCQELLAYPTLSSVRGEFMIQEKMYRQFLGRIRDCLAWSSYGNEATILVLDKYEKNLAAQEPEAVRDLYIDFVRKNSVHTSSRYQYQMLVQYLKKVEEYPMGKKLVKQIATEWRSLYPRRRAMMEELERAGF